MGLKSPAFYAGQNIDGRIPNVIPDGFAFPLNMNKSNNYPIFNFVAYTPIWRHWCELKLVG